MKNNLVIMQVGEKTTQKSANILARSANTK